MMGRGVGFEVEFCEMLAGVGFWAHRLSPDNSGAQPFDVIAASEGTAIAFECKECATNRFPLSRVEDNQVMGFGQFLANGNNSVWFAFKRGRDDSVWLTDARLVLAALEAGVASIPAGEIPWSDWKMGQYV